MNKTLQRQERAPAAPPLERLAANKELFITLRGLRRRGLTNNKEIVPSCSYIYELSFGATGLLKMALRKR